MCQNKYAKIYSEIIITVCNAIFFRLCIDLMHILPPVTAEGFDGSHHPRFAEWPYGDSHIVCWVPALFVTKPVSSQACSSRLAWYFIDHSNSISNLTNFEYLLSIYRIFCSHNDVFCCCCKYYQFYLTLFVENCPPDSVSLEKVTKKLVTDEFLKLDL